MVWDTFADVDAQELLWGKAQKMLGPIYMTFSVQAGYSGCMPSSNFFNKSSKNHLVNNSAGVLSVLSQTPEFTESKAISSLYSGFLLDAFSDLYKSALQLLHFLQ